MNSGSGLQRQRVRLADQQSKKTGADGIAVFDLSTQATNNSDFFAAAIERGPAGIRKRLQLSTRLQTNQLAHLRLHRPARLSARRNRAMEVRRAPILRGRLLDSRQSEDRIRDHRPARHES